MFGAGRPAQEDLASRGNLGRKNNLFLNKKFLADHLSLGMNSNAIFCQEGDFGLQDRILFHYVDMIVHDFERRGRKITSKEGWDVDGKKRKND